MAFVAVSSLMRSLEFQFLHPQPRLTLSNKKQIESLHEKLGGLLVFLDKFEKNADNLPEMRAVIEEIIDVSVKAEDDIEEELLTASFSSTKVEETLQRVVDEVEKLVQITMKTTELVNSNLTVGGSSSHEYSSDLFNSNVDVVHEEDAMVMVGHSEELNKVMNQLLVETNRRNQTPYELERINTLQVMSVVGMGGIGKTTFAKRIYEDPRVKSHFELRAWTTMSPEHNTGQAILDLCYCVMPSSSAFNKEMQDDHLAAHLRQSLSGQRYLIIVDDIWTSDAWDDIKRCFPDDNNRSRILLTTRDAEVSYYCASRGEYLYSMRFLNQDEGWDLFYQKFLDKELLHKDEFKTIGMNIVRKCQGLPLVVVIMAGLLSKTNKSIDEWGKFEKKLNSLLALDVHDQFSRMFTLSYNQLPSHLKGCFLYLGVFHRDSEISVKKLIRLWIAEGLVKTRPHMRLEEVGRYHLHDLINRSLLMVNERSFDGQIKTCRMHQLLHELCTSKAKTENLVYLETTGSRHSFGHFVRLGYQRWLSLKVVNPDFHISISSKQWRSILCFNGCGAEWYLQATSFKKLRVLDLSKIEFKSGMPGDITELVFLRYLALASSMLLKHIPLDKNWNLQTLIISEGDDKDAHKLLPHGIWDNLPQLRHLEINHKLQVSIDRLKVQINMQTLYWLSISQCTMEVFMRIPNVEELGIVAGGQDEVSPQGLNNLCYLNFLEKLRFQGSDHPLHLPPFNTFPRSLKELTFVSTRIPWSEMSIISMLPRLELLKLKNFACTGQKWELTEDVGFPRLKVMIISRTDLKEWKADVDSHFPQLQRLLLKECFELKKMPDWIVYVFGLQLIKLVHCYASLVHSANMIKEEQREEYGNFMLDVIDFHTRPDHYYEEEDSSE